MDVQRLYPLVLWSPPSLFLRRGAAQEEPRSPPLPTGAGGPATAPSAQPPGSDLPAATPPTRPCPACLWATEAVEGRQQAGYWKSMFARCKQREECLRQQLAALHEQNWQRLYEQSQERERALQQQVAALQAQICILEQRLRGRKSERKKRHAEAVRTGPSATARRRGQQPSNPAPRRRTFDHLPTVEESCELPAAGARCPQCGAPFAPFT